LRGEKMATITELQKRIVKALETGQDPAPILKELGELRAKIAAEAELEQLQKVANARQALRDQAEAVKGKVQKQGEAIDAFLKARDAITEALAPILDKARELPKLQSECYAEYRRPGDLAWATKLPEGYLPKGLAVPMLEGSDNVSDAQDRAAQAVWYISAGLGLLQSLKREDRPIPERPATEFEAIDNDPYPDPPCKVCQHPERAAIDKALAEGVSLRDIASQYGISKSTVDRHKAHLEG
jgi:hypothetical protein